MSPLFKSRGKNAVLIRDPHSVSSACLSLRAGTFAGIVTTTTATTRCKHITVIKHNQFSRRFFVSHIDFSFQMVYDKKLPSKWRAFYDAEITCAPVLCECTERHGLEGYATRAASETTSKCPDTPDTPCWHRKCSALLRPRNNQSSPR